MGPTNWMTNGFVVVLAMALSMEMIFANDLAFINVDAGSSNIVNFVSLQDIAASTEIYITNNLQVFNESAGYQSAGVLKWTAAANFDLEAGSRVNIKWSASSSIRTSDGSAIFLDANNKILLSTAGNTLVLFNGTVYEPNFLAAIMVKNDATFIDDLWELMELIPEVELGENTVVIDQYVHVGYSINSPTIGTVEDFKDYLFYSSYWVGDDNGLVPSPSHLTIL